MRYGGLWSRGIRSKTGTHPGGVGLKFLQDFIALNRGKLQIASRRGFYECLAGDEKYATMPADFRGTAVNVEINTADTEVVPPAF